MRAIIIEDEPQAISALKHELALHCPEIIIIAIAQNIADGITSIKQHQPELVFLDIQLSDGLGFSILENIKDINFNVIMTTAYSQYALQAIKFSALDYLLKPIDATELKVAVQKAINQSQSDFNKRISLFLDNQNSRNKRIALSSSNGISIHEVDSIIRCQAQGNYTYFHFTDGSKLLVSKTMKEFNELLLPYNFERIHHAHMINMNHLSSYEKADGGSVIMSDNTALPISQRKRSAFIKLLSNFNSK